MSTTVIAYNYRASTFIKVVSVIVAILTAGYMLPWAIACLRDVPHTAVFWVNLLLGWTLVGWIVALVMSIVRERPASVSVVSAAPLPEITTPGVVTGTVVYDPNDR